MNEKNCVNDILKELNSTITMINYSIEQSNNETFRDVLIDYQTSLINFQWDVYNIAKEKQYYIPAAPAGKSDIEQVKNSVSK
ncbi:MAG: spore coat protein [Clostridia bacterium]